MKWVALRQSRLELIVGLIIIFALAAIFVPASLEKHDLYRDLGLENISRDSKNYSSLSSKLVESYEWLDVFVLQFITVVPILIGMLLAMPVVIEFERRTYRLAWTQSITRGRWLFIKLGLALLAAIVFSVLLSALVGWLLAPQESVIGPFHNFAKHGMVPVLYAVFAFAVALFVGTLTRRTALALIMALFVSAVTVIGIGHGLRPHYMTPEKQVSTVTVSPGTMPESSTFIYGITRHDIEPIPPSMKASEKIPDRAWVVDEYLIDESGNRVDYIFMSSDTEYTMDRVVYYHPESRYWAFQVIESGIFLGFSVLFLGTVVWVVKRRMT